MLEYIIGGIITVIMFKVLWESTLMIDERKARFRAGTHDYYDNKIEKDDHETIS